VGQAISLADLLAGTVVELAASVADLEVTGMTQDSRRVLPGDLFVALSGARHDGHALLGEARDAGALAALTERPVPTEVLPTITVPQLREHLGELAARCYAYPSRAMHLTAITGTNGKTTVSQLLGQLVRACGYGCGVIGTLGASLDGAVVESSHTTPDAIALQRILAGWLDEALPFVAMEASSHALEQRRLDGLDVDTGVFTNLTRDHLDYHGSMQAYGRAKARLAGLPGLRTLILNGDDPFSVELRAAASAGQEVLTFGLADTATDLRARAVEGGADGLRFRLESPWGEARLHCPLVGAFNVPNLLAAMAAALTAGMPFDAVCSAASSLQPIPGRMQPLRRSGAPLVVVDYAHTPDALAQALQALRTQCQGRLIVVFGCGGDRDRGKLPLMAAAASEHADFSVLTSDNPRGEDPAAIIADIVNAMTGPFEAQPDRREAIGRALALAGPGDCVLIAGKGHEDYQEIAGRRRPFSDIEAARQWLEGRAA